MPTSNFKINSPENQERFILQINQFEAQLLSNPIPFGTDYLPY